MISSLLRLLSILISDTNDVVIAGHGYATIILWDLSKLGIDHSLVILLIFLTDGFDLFSLRGLATESIFKSVNYFLPHGAATAGHHRAGYGATGPLRRYPANEASRALNIRVSHNATISLQPHHRRVISGVPLCILILSKDSADLSEGGQPMHLQVEHLGDLILRFIRFQLLYPNVIIVLD